MPIVRTILKSIGLYEPLVKYKRELDKKTHDRNELKNKANRAAFYRSFLKTGDLVFDVGANMGNRVEIFLEIGCRVVAVEPQKECQDFLNKQFGSTISLVTDGLGEKEEDKTMFISDESTISSLSEEWIESVKQSRFRGHEWNKTVMIHITTMDHLISKFGVPDFCKIDVEGYELQVLKGLTQAIPSMSLEYTVPEQTNRLLECIAITNGLSSAYEYNYSTGEDMHFAKPNFVNYEEFKRIVVSEEFQRSGFGDIYIRKSK